MNDPVILVDFVRCQCGHHIPIQRTKHAPEEASLRWSETDIGESFFAACTVCKRVSRFRPAEFRAIGSQEGVAPDIPDAPIRVFRVPIECDELDCRSQAVVLVALSATTTRAELEEEKNSWRWKHGELVCEAGHPQPYPRWH